MEQLTERLKATTAFIQEHTEAAPGIGIILGSGLGNFLSGLDDKTFLDYREIPNFPVSTVEGHDGKLVFGKIHGKSVVVLAGRFHFYEGYSAEEVVYPVRVLQSLGVRTLLISNAAGGVNPDFSVGDLMIITDHISMAIVNPLLGKNVDTLGPRFPDMSEPYNKNLIRIAHDAAAAKQLRLKEGVYFGVTGPTFETRAEYKMIRILGADAVGMSTVQEVIAAVHCGMSVFAVSVITDLGIREEDNVITHQEVLDAAAKAEPILTSLFRDMIREL
jgi:purine-nucleoside phosphorylase